MPVALRRKGCIYMNTVEKLGYLKGLLDGLDFDENKKETKMFKAVIDVLDGIMQDLDGLGEDVDILAEQVDEIDQDLADVEEYLEDEDFCDCCDDAEDDEYCISCPNCGEEFVVDADTVEEGGVECPSCGEYLELGFVPDDEDEEAPAEE